MIYIMYHCDPKDYGIYSLFVGLHSWIFVISDSIALQSLIQFGLNTKIQSKVNLLTLEFHIVLTLIPSIIFSIFSTQFSIIFNEPNLITIGTFLPILTLLFIPRTYCIKLVYRDQSMFKLFFINLAFFGTMSTLVISYLQFYNTISHITLFYIYLLGSLFSSLVAIFLVKSKLIFSKKGDFHYSKILRFGLQMFSINTLHSMPKFLDIYFIKLFFPIEIVGLYSGAKNLFRVFEEILNAANGLVYPSAIKQIVNNNKTAYKELIIKSSSILFVLFLFITMLSFTGIFDLIILKIFPQKFHNSILHFDILIYSLPFMSFIIFYSFMTAEGKLKQINIFVLISLIISTITLYFIGHYKLKNYIAFGLTVYNVCLGLMVLGFALKNMNYKITYLFSFIFDFKNYLIKLSKRKNSGTL